MTEPCPDAYVAFAARLADASGEILRRYFRTPLVVESKSDRTPVTLADRAAETALRELIAEAYPDHGVIGEEFAPHNPDSRLVWVVDPIDGTKSFVSGNPLFGTLIALVRDGQAILGVIDHPALGDRWVGAVGRTTTFNGACAATRAGLEIGSAILCCAAPEMFEGADAEAFERVRRSVRFCRYSADCFAYGLLASGLIDLVIEANLGVHDFCALVPVVAGAGGIITDWQGRSPGLDSDGRILAAGDASLHVRARDFLGG